MRVQWLGSTCCGLKMTTPACTAADPDLFFPPTYGGSYKSVVREAKAICMRCAIRRECLERAVADNEELGIWGGTTPWERSLLPKRRQPTAIHLASREEPTSRV